MALIIDTHKIHSMLVSAGFEKAKADVLVQAITMSYEELATKSDLEMMKKDLVIHQWAVGSAVVAILAAIRFF